MGRLERVIDNKREYERLLNKVEELEAITEKVTTSFSLTPKGKGNHQKDDDYVKLLEYKERCKGKLDEYMQSCIELDEELDKIDNPSVRVAMKYRYIDGKTVVEIAETMHYTERNMYEILRNGKKVYNKMFYNNNIEFRS